MNELFAMVMVLVVAMLLLAPSPLNGSTANGGGAGASKSSGGTTSSPSLTLSKTATARLRREHQTRDGWNRRERRQQQCEHHTQCPRHGTGSNTDGGYPRRKRNKSRNGGWEVDRISERWLATGRN